MRDKYTAAKDAIGGVITLTKSGNLFQVTKLISTRNLSRFVNSINEKTRDAYINEQTRIAPNLWLLHVVCSWRDDAQVIRSL